MQQKKQYCIKQKHHVGILLLDPFYHYKQYIVVNRLVENSKKYNLLSLILHRIITLFLCKYKVMRIFPLQHKRDRYIFIAHKNCIKIM